MVYLTSKLYKSIQVIRRHPELLAMIDTITCRIPCEVISQDTFNTIQEIQARARTTDTTVVHACSGILIFWYRSDSVIQ